MNRNKSTHSPHGFFSTAVFAAATVLPQIILLLMNIYYFTIGAGECTADQLRLIYAAGSIESGLLVFYIFISLLYCVKRRDIHPPVIILCTVLPVLYLWFFSAYFDDFWPWLPVWIASSDHLVFYQYAFTMPAVVYGLMRLSMAGLERAKVKQYLLLAGALLGIPLIWFILSRVSFFNAFARRLHVADWIITTVIICFFILTTALLLFALFRLLAAAYRGVMQRGYIARMVLYAAAGIVMPVAGLLLNRAIPFPSDYQHPVFYILAVCNGILLCAPDMKYSFINKAAFAGRAFFFPFTFYFFLSFLPFVPLSIPAMLVAGAGFLILTPLILFILHIHALGEDFKKALHRSGKRAAYIALLLPLTLMPLTCLAVALSDRMQINSAIAYVYENDYAAGQHFNGSISALKRVLERQEKMKSGSQLPFIDGMYNWIVFDNLILPDAKADYIHKTFLGSGVADIKDNDIGLAGFLFSAPRSPRVKDAAAIAQEKNSADSVISAITTTSAVKDGYVKTEAVLTLKNNSPVQSEFRAEMSVSSGVLLSGYWLMVGKEKVPGRIFEKKTALWVFEAIKSVRRDPGVVFYRSDNNFLLKVFPFAPGETRTTGIEFIYPQSARPTVVIGGKRLPLQPPSDSAPLIAYGEESVMSFFPAAEKKKLTVLHRRPVVYLIADRSVSGVSADDIVRAADLCTEKIPQAGKIILLTAHYESGTVSVEGINGIRNITDEELNRMMPKRGSFCADRALRHCVLSSPSTDDFFPLPVLITKGGNILREENGSYFAGYAPDCGGIYFTDGLSLRAEFFNGKASGSLIIHPVRKAAAAGQPLYLPDDGMDSAVMTPGVKKSGVVADQDLYQQALAAEGDYTAMMQNPSLTEKLRRSLVQRARNSGVLNGAVSYIAVESPSQWRILEEKEKQKLKGKDALEIAESPEPPMALIALLLVCVWAVYMILKKKILQRG